ncbi:MAG: endonuclease/exonuclease/phosphatase family protein [Anaerolineales bacterium]|nr:endonuclease/exonuclease/phosphatase family protein [Anaerolineales bacterium]
MKTARKPKNLFLFFSVTLPLLWLIRLSNSARNYPEANYPVYSGAFAAESVAPVNNLTVASYNIRYAQQIETAIAELQTLLAHEGLDILLLQEMTEPGAEQIARALDFNYVYFPAAVEPRHNQDFGNAVLSRWPISDSQKLILPHKSLNSRMIRIATRATLAVDSRAIVVYSVHAETILTLPSFRRDQFEAVLVDSAPETELAIIGGDFNSVTLGQVAGIEALYEPAGFTRASANSGHTLVRFGTEAFADHIFSKGFTILASGKIADATASDHLPIWTRLALN